MPLNSLFKQREIGKTYGSNRSKVPLNTPSGPQVVESALEKNLLLQLIFSGKVSDVITQPILDYEVNGAPRTYTPDFLVQLFPGIASQSLYYLIEVKRAADLDAKSAVHAPKFDAARAWCRDHIGEFRIVTDADVGSPYLINTQLLAHHIGQEPEDNVFNCIKNVVAVQPISVRGLKTCLIGKGIVPMNANVAVEQMVANRYVHCDLARKYSDDTILSALTWQTVHDHDLTPVTRMIRASRSDWNR